MTEASDKVFQLADVVGLAQADFQRDFKHVDPVVGIMRSMRDAGFAADALTIDNISDGKRILFILHDHSPEVLEYQFTYKDQDPDLEFKKISLDKADSKQFYNWMKAYFMGS